MSLRARLLLLVLLSSIGPLLTLLGFLLQDRATAIDNARALLGGHVQVLARDLDDKIAGTTQLLFGLARVPLIDTPDRAACSAFLAEVLREHPQYTGLLTILPNGQLHCDSLRTGRTLDLRDRAYFQRALQAHGPVLEPVIGRLTGKGVLQIALPVRDRQGHLRLILLASFDMAAYGAAQAPQLPFAAERLQLWNHDGSVIIEAPASPGGPKITAAERRHMLGGHTERVATVGTGDARRIWATSTIPRSESEGMQLALSVPETVLLADIDRRFQRRLTGLLALAALYLAGAALFAELSLRRHTQRLLQAIARLSVGVFDQPIGRPYPRGELGAVMASLDGMGEALSNEREALREHTRALQRQAGEDALTGLANRNRLTQCLEQALASARRRQHPAAVMMLDLDRFKTVNDSLGHAQGDLLLQAVAARLTQAVRTGDTIARLGGDEFVIVLTDLRDEADIAAVARQILDTVAQPLQLERHSLPISTSLGIAVFPRDGDTPEILLQHADSAMYRAKEQGGSTLAFFSPEMMQASIERLQTETGLRQALSQRELRLHFQPIVDAANGRIVSAEALVRWQHPQRGLVPPLQFIPIAEETGLIVPIGEWVLREACRVARDWQRRGLGDIPVAVNISARQFAAPSLEADITAALHDNDCPPTLLQLEITESTVMEQADAARQLLHRLKHKGLRLAIDDFGTGYSSLAQLKRLPVDKVKIDRSFVRDITSDPQDAAIVDAIVTLARKLDLRILAEGVETVAQRTFLELLGCDEYQGYLFSKPCPAEAFEALLRQQRSP